MHLRCFSFSVEKYYCQMCKKICPFLFNIGWLRVVTTVHWIKMQVIKNYRQPWDVLFTLPCKSELSLLSKSYNFYRATENFALFLSLFYLKSQSLERNAYETNVFSTWLFLVIILIKEVSTEHGNIRCVGKIITGWPLLQLKVHLKKAYRK